MQVDAGWTGCGFGLRIIAPYELETLSACSSDAELSSVAWVPVADESALERAWCGTAARLLDRRFDDGRPILSVDSGPDGSYRIESPGYGVHVVAAGGDQVTSLLPGDVGWRWQRLFAAQALPLAAAIRGLEPLHASAVTFGRGVAAFSAPSGTGKTSLVTHLVAGGGTLVTDDVLAVEARPDALYAHPGARLLAAARHELAAVGDGRDRLGGVLESGEGVLEWDEEVFLRPPLEQKPLPLVALYRPVRVADALRLDIAEEMPPSPPSLLSTIFLMHLKEQMHLERRLDVLSRLAKEVRVFNVRIPADLDAQRTASLLREHIDELPSP